MLVVAIIFATCSGDTSDNQSEDKKTVASPFDHSKSKAKTKQNNLSSTKRPEATPDLTKQALLKLPVSGVVDYLAILKAMMTSNLTILETILLLQN